MCLDFQLLRCLSTLLHTLNHCHAHSCYSARCMVSMMSACASMGQSMCGATAQMCSTTSGEGVGGGQRGLAGDTGFYSSWQDAGGQPVGGHLAGAVWGCWQWTGHGRSLTSSDSTGREAMVGPCSSQGLHGSMASSQPGVVPCSNIAWVATMSAIPEGSCTQQVQQP
jgi:hypothetical protein